MGQSTDGLLWYGVAIEGTADDGDELAEKIDTILNGEEGELYGDGREWFAEHNLPGVDIVRHCSYEYVMYGLAVAGTYTRAWRGSPKLVEIPDFPPDTTQLEAVLKELGAEDLPIGWHLASMWG